MSTLAEILVNLFSFIKKESKGDLNPDEYQLAFRDPTGLMSLVIKHLGSKKERELGRIGLKLGLF